MIYYYYYYVCRLHCHLYVILMQCIYIFIYYYFLCFEHVYECVCTVVGHAKIAKESTEMRREEKYNHLCALIKL